ncbi:porin [Pseudobacteriovorax antillogorgiicola]|uniref:Phosphate-selective porin O and P n=1 Tax=Pseudobacteriovorax antillogorgiicola TaxID=1513793 RepID=A0A1Y6BCR8_9BACT|nr:porin [Pseudobacteriovorax antillogorgiicola]TCS57434.1 phosphate-selective porin O/P [Pseudobacteriovorax antillogorgiicola]SMF01111.1 Phosphate-selective porin O and P [Pseudobacteriovorax antillogorgiicola]
MISVNLRFAIAVSCAALSVGCPSLYAKKRPKVKIGLESRFDLSFSQNEGDDDQHSFTSIRNRVTLSGKITKKSSFLIRFRFDRGPANNDPVANVSDSADYFFMRYNFSKKYSLILGKIYLFEGSYENDYNTADIYHVSYAGENEYSGFGTGAIFEAHLWNQTFGFQLANTPFQAAPLEGAATPSPTAGDFLVALAWYGKSKVDWLKPLVTMGVFPRVPQENLEGVRSDKVSSSKIAIGNKASLKSFEIDTEFLYISNPEYRTFAAASDPEPTQVNPSRQVQTLILQGRYKTKKPKIDYIAKISQDDIQQEGESKSLNRISLATEYYPQKSRFRFHSALTKEDNLDGRRNTILFGMAASF